MNATPPELGIRSLLSEVAAGLRTVAAGLREPSLLALRLTVSPGAILPPSVAARLLPMGDAAALAWLKREQLVRSVDGRDVVVWADVLAALPECPRDAAPARATSRSARSDARFRRGGGL